MIDEAKLARAMADANGDTEKEPLLWPEYVEAARAAIAYIRRNVMTVEFQDAREALATADEALLFLMGFGPLEGCHFGEKPPHERGAFWWRSRLQPMRDILTTAPAMLARIEALEAENARLRLAVCNAGMKFEFYAASHAKKGTLYGDAKAQSNQQMADKMRAALTSPTEQGDAQCE